MNQLTTTIDIKKLTLGDWLLIAESNEYKSTWAFFNWLEYASTVELEDLNRKQIREIAETLDYSTTWVESQIRKYA